MFNGRTHDSATSDLLGWSSQGAHMQREPEDEVAAEVDEPPDDCISQRDQHEFKRSTVRRNVDNSQSLLTKALHHQSDDEAVRLNFHTSPSRRRSMNSNISLASTAELTCDTGLTSPARTNTPSPPPQVIQLGRLGVDYFGSKQSLNNRFYGNTHEDTTPTKKAVDSALVDDRPKDPAVEALTKKRCISFACGPKAEVKKSIISPQPSLPSQTTSDVVFEKPPQRRSCIKFACPTKPSARSTPPSKEDTKKFVPEVVVEPSEADAGGSPATLRKTRSPSSIRSKRSLTPRRPSRSPIAIKSKKYLTADSKDLNSESSRFHEFASDEPQEDDWIRHNLPASTQRLTINDTLRKENEIRQLGKEAEEEALQEELEEDELENDEEDDLDNVDEEEGPEEEVDDEDDDQSGYGSDDDASDGYNTDNENGFADSDVDADEGDDLDLWTHGQASALHLSGATPVNRRPSLTGNRSDTSSSSDAPVSRLRRLQEKTRRIKVRPGTPELPDSTDFVCGTLDEDRPLEDAYISCIAQRRREKLHVIPQDIDPSFPTSEPEDDEADNVGHDSDDHVWIHGELEDLHHEHTRVDRRKKRSEHASPKRLQSPPPKRHHSPAPKARGRSPRRLFDRHSPRRLLSPPPSGRPVRSPAASPVQNAKVGGIDFRTLAHRPGLTHTKSLPRAPVTFLGHLKGQRRRLAAHSGAHGHVRGAIDIVKGLEQKRQRRREKYIQKHCNRARKGQVTERRPEPGKGAQRMRELGLHIAGKHGPDHYVLSI
ncbi:hypothetical protein BJ170DRAFT_336317 [Xylariales sp. AK1849]|nr:hypothetical protein BJ170DRAFT_336317 [Xylariales sp. AK1849]